MMLPSTKHSRSRHQRIALPVGFLAHVCKTVEFNGWQGCLIRISTVNVYFGSVSGSEQVAGLA